MMKVKVASKTMVVMIKPMMNCFLADARPYESELPIPMRQRQRRPAMAVEHACPTRQLSGALCPSPRSNSCSC